MTTSLVNEFRKAEAQRENRCPTCNQRLRHLNPHSMDRRKVEVLEAIAKLNSAGIVWVKVQRDGNLIRPEDQETTIQTDDVHALRLVWFGLLMSKGKRTGMYRATPAGFDFLGGRHSVPRKIYCRDGKMETSERTLVYVHQVRGVIFDKAYWDSYHGIQLEDRRFT